MNKLTILLMMAFLISVLVLPTNANSFLTYYAERKTPVIDGKAEELWDNVEWAPLDYNWIAKAEASVRYKALWDEEALYLLVQSTNYYERDSVEIYLDENFDSRGVTTDEAYGADDRGTVISFANGVGADNTGYRRSDLATYECSVTATEWLLEIRLEYNVIQGSEGHYLGFDIQYNNFLEGTKDPTAPRLCWNNEAWINNISPGMSFQHLGRIQLVGTYVPAETEPVNKKPYKTAPADSTATPMETGKAGNTDATDTTEIPGTKDSDASVGQEGGVSLGATLGIAGGAFLLVIFGAFGVEALKKHKK